METAYNYEYKYDVVSDGTKICSLSLKGLLALMCACSNSKINMIKIWRSYPLELEPTIEWYTNNKLSTISATPLLTGRGKIRAMGALVHALYNHEYITTEMYDKYWNYMNEWPMDKYVVSICAEEKVEPESDKLVCYFDSITGKMCYVSEQVAKSIAKQIEDDMNIPWGDSEGYSKYFKGEGNMKININTGGIDTSDNYSKLVRTYYLGQVNNPYNICATKMETTIKPASGRYKCEKGLDSVIRKVQINEKKKVCTIVWTDGQVTLAKCGENDIWDPEKGLLVCIAKRFWVSGTQFNKWLKAQIPEAGPVEKAAEFFDEKLADTYVPKHATK